MEKGLLSSGLWIGMQRPRPRTFARIRRIARDLAIEDVVFVCAAAAGLGGTLWMIAAIAAGYAARG
jgi:hypothetical protein